MKSFSVILVVLSALLLSACERGLSQRDRDCIDLTGSVCGSRAISYGPTSPGTYQNHYGNPAYGSWSGGQYHFNDPFGAQAMATNSFLLGAGLGGLTAYALTKAAGRDSWERENPNGYTPRSREQKTYIDKGGKEISKTEFDKRKAQSRKDRVKAKAAKAKQAVAKKAAVAKQKAVKAKQAVVKNAKSATSKKCVPSSYNSYCGKGKKKTVDFTKKKSSSYSNSSSSRKSSSSHKSSSKRR